jgi:hypothetical protein
MSVCLMTNLMIFRIWVLTTVSLLLPAHLALADAESFNRLSGEVVRLAEAKDYDKATAVAKEALESANETFGRDSFESEKVLRALGEISLVAKRAGEASTYYEKILGPCGTQKRRDPRARRDAAQ